MTNGANSTTLEVDGAPATIVNMDGVVEEKTLDRGVHIPMEETTRTRSGSTSVSLKMRDDDYEEDHDELPGRIVVDEAMRHTMSK